MGSNVSDWQLEKLLAGDLDAPAAAKVSAALEQAGEGGRLEALRASNAQILEQYAPARVAAEVRRRAELPRVDRRPAWTWLGAPLTGAALAVLVALALRPPSPATRSDETREVTVIKGDPELWIYRKSGGGQDLLRAGDLARRGDLLQLRYGPSDSASYGVVLSFDGRGSVTLHFPVNAAESTALAQAGDALPHAYELDDAPSYERFVFVTSAEPINVQWVLDAAHALGKVPATAEHETLPLPDSLHQKSIVLRKAAP